MAYNDNDWEVQVRGTLAGVEEWSNSWSFIDLVGLQDPAGFEAPLRDFYDDITGFASWLSDGYVVTSGTTRKLLTGELSSSGAFSFTGGNSAVDILPLQLAMRISLTAPGNVNGGPYIAGFCEAANDEGRIAAACRTDFIGALNTFGDALTANGFALAINRTSIEDLVAVTGGRLGERWDVIRKRANELTENFSLWSVA